MKLDDRNKMIQELVDNMESWDYATLLVWAQDQMTEILSDGSPEALQAEYDSYKSGGIL